MSAAGLVGQDRLLESMRGAIAGSAWPATLTAQTHDNDVCRFAESRVHQPQALRNHTVTVRVFRDGRAGIAATNDLSADGLGAALRRATDAAPAMPSLPDGYPLPGQRPLDVDAARVDEAARSRGFDHDTATVEPAAKADVLGRAFAAGRLHGVRFAGAWTTGTHERAVVDSAGLARYHHGTWAEASVWALTTDGVTDVSAFAGDLGSRNAQLDPTKLADHALQRCLLGRRPRTLDPGRWDVVLAPHAVGAILDWLGPTGFDSRSHVGGTGFLAGREGERVTSEAVSIADDATFPHPRGVPLPFDDDGVSLARVPLIDRGTAMGAVHSTLSASRAGCSSTGHAFVGGLIPNRGGRPARLVFSPGDSSVDDLVAGVERGIYVTRFHYLNGFLDTRRALMTGLTRDGAFLIEDGRIVAGIRNMRFVEPMLEAFDRIDGIGDEQSAVATWLVPTGIHLAPALRVRGFRFTGRQELGTT